MPCGPIRPGCGVLGSHMILDRPPTHSSPSHDSDKLVEMDLPSQTLHFRITTSEELQRPTKIGAPKRSCRAQPHSGLCGGAILNIFSTSDTPLWSRYRQYRDDEGAQTGLRISRNSHHLLREDELGIQMEETSSNVSVGLFKIWRQRGFTFVLLL